MKTVCAFVGLALAASTGTASAAAIAKISTTVGAHPLDVTGTVTFGQAESTAQLTIELGNTNTGKITIDNTIKIKTPSCKSGEATLSTVGSVALAPPTAFTTAYDAAKLIVDSLPDLDSTEKIAYSTTMGTGQAIEYEIPVSSHPVMRATGSGATLSVNMANVGVMAKGVKVPLSLKVSVLDTTRVDVNVPCDGKSKPCDYAAQYCSTTYVTTSCEFAYCGMCGTLESVFGTPIIDIEIDLMKQLKLATVAADSEAADMFVDCPGTGDKTCLAVGDVTGECTAADKKQKKLDSAGAKALVGTLAMCLVAVAMAVLH